MLGRQADLESPYSYIIKVSIYLIKHFPVPIRVRFQGLPLPHCHGQQKSPTAKELYCNS